MNFPFYIAKRYALSLSKSTAINIITAIASLSIIISTMALFVVLSGFSGLREISLSYTNQIDPELKIFPKTGKSLTVLPHTKQQIQNSNLFDAFSEIVEERVLFAFNEKQQVAYIKGVDSNFTQVTDIHNKLYTGQWIEPNSLQAVAGYAIADKMSMGLYDYQNKFEVFAPKPGKGNIESRNAFFQETLFPVGIYALSEDLDQKYVFTDIAVAKSILNFNENQISAIEFKLAPGVSESKAANFLNDIFSNKIVIKNKAQLNEGLYKMLNTENLAVYLIFTLVIIVALFNLVGALIMMIFEKKQNLKTLFNLGVEIKSLRKVFLYQGMLITVVGCAIGLLLGFLLIFTQQQTNMVMINENIPYPTKFEAINLITVVFTVLCLGFFASLIASSRVNKYLIT